MTIEKQILHLMSKVEEIEGKELIKIYETMNYTPQTIRNLLSKLKKGKYIKSLNRSIYQITSLGKEIVTSSYTNKNYYNEKWDGKWYIILMEIPEVERKKRDVFRRNLIQLGFGQLYKSTYIYPWDISQAVINIIDSLEIEEYVTILASNEFILNDISTEGYPGMNKATKIWDIEKINDVYKEKLNWFKHDFEPTIVELLNGQNKDPLKIFSNYLQISEAINELLSIDPMLPPEFLPMSCIGTNVLSEFYRSHHSLATLIPKDCFYYKFVEERL